MNQEPAQQWIMRSRKQRTRAQRHKRSRAARRAVTELREWLLTAAAVFAVMLLLNLYVFNLSMVKGQSMQPTLYEGERLFIDKLSLALAGPRRGDVVVLHDPSRGLGPREYLVKRVIGIPGDLIEVRNHRLYVNGTLKEEPYVDSYIEDEDFAPVTVEPDRYFVMGDNRHEGRSKDSRFFGSVPGKLIVGRAAFIWWPLSKLERL